MNLKSQLLSLLLLIPFLANAQKKDSTKYQSRFHMNYKRAVPLIAGGATAVLYGYSRTGPNSNLSSEKAMTLKRSDVNRFDRSVLDFPASEYEQAQKTSDLFLNTSLGLPVLLMLDRRIRKDWKEVGLMYLESHIYSSSLYLGANLPINRPRPFTYNTDLPFSDRIGNNRNNSFFSGHVGSTASATFFTAKIYSEYHDFSTLQKALLYTVAAAPPAVVALYRMRAGKHFRTDVMLGFAVGAASGILTPELHKRRKNRALSYIPVYSRDFKGLSMLYKF